MTERANTVFLLPFLHSAKSLGAATISAAMWSSTHAASASISCVLVTPCGHGQRATIGCGVLAVYYHRQSAGIRVASADTLGCLSAVITAQARRARVGVGKWSGHSIEPPYRVAFPAASSARRHGCTPKPHGQVVGSACSHDSFARQHSCLCGEQNPGADERALAL